MTAKVILLQRRKNAVAPPIPPGLPEITALNFAAQFLAESPIRNEPKAKFIIVTAKLCKFCD